MHKSPLYWVGIAVLILLLLAVFVVALSAAEESNVTVDYNITETPAPIPTNIQEGYRIPQGACVFPGETIDIAGMGWNSGTMNYYGPYYDGFSGTNTSWTASYTLDYRNLSNFYVEPNFFRAHQGWWYMEYDVPDNAGNDRLFYVNETCPNLFINVSGRIVSQIIPETKAENESEIQAAIMANLTKMPVLSENDGAYILSRNVTTTLDAPAGTHSWMFGTESPPSLYDQPVPAYNIITFDASVLRNLEEGSYNIIFIEPGANGIIEEIYDPIDDRIVSPFRDVSDISLRGIAPLVAENFLLSKVANSHDDSYEKWGIDLQDPKIMVTKLDQAPLTNNHSVIILAGYTNMNQGDNLTITFDANRTNPYIVHQWFLTVQNNGGEGAYRVWNTSFIMDFNQIAPGQHSFTITSNEGATAIIPIYRRVELFPNYMPPEELGFFDNSPFIPPVFINTTVKVPGTRARHSIFT